MEPSEVDRIERELSISLPREYRDALVSYPVAAWRGNADTELWDDASAIIAFNLELRAGAPGGVPPWPPHMFAMGHGGDGSPSAIDLRDPSAPIWWVEKCGLDNSGSGPTGETFGGWFSKYVADLRHDLEADGIDPDGTAAAREGVEEANAKQGCSWLVIMVGLGLAIVLVIFLVSQRT